MQGRKIHDVPRAPAGGELVVKTLISVFITLALLVAAGIGEHFFVVSRFERLGTAVDALYDKTMQESASRADADAVKTLWEDEKKSLHILIPHADIAYIDYWLGEATGCIVTGNFADALSKLEVLAVICQQLPQQYTVSIENLF